MSDKSSGLKLVDKNSITQNADKQKCYKLYTNLGISNVLFKFMTPEDQVCLQVINRFYYDSAVSRV